MFKTHRSMIPPFGFAIGDFYREIHLAEVAVFFCRMVFDIFGYTYPTNVWTWNTFGYIARRFAGRGNETINQVPRVVKNEDLLKQVKDLQDGFQNQANRRLAD